MEALDNPIEIGALFEDDEHYHPLRIDNLYIDTDMDVQIHFYYEGFTDADKGQMTVDMESFIDQIGETIHRTNTPHEAWEWRNDR